VSRSIVEAHGGQLWAENNKAGGAIFNVALPLSHASLTTASIVKNISDLETPGAIPEASQVRSSEQREYPAE
jgi:hypothetical protein